MKQSQRTIAFISTMLLTFGISSFKFKHPEFVNNERAYLVIVAGLILAIIFLVQKFKK